MKVERMILLACIVASSPAMANNWYVDGLNGNDSNSGTKSAPFRTAWHAIMSMAQPGDTVHFLPTTVYPSIGVFGKSGTATAPITIQGDGAYPNYTQVSGGGSNFGIQLGSSASGTPSSYIVVQNFDVQAPGNWSGIYVSQGCHHIAIDSNRAHNSGISGINTYGADYIVIAGNAVYGNSSHTQGGKYGSGISLYENADIDTNTGTKMIVRGNWIYKNTNVPATIGGSDPDGSGIILDDSRHTQSNNVAYNGHTAIENNVVYSNGGRGIYMYESDHASIVNNSTYENNTDPYEANWHPGEIGLVSSGDAQIYNNITYSTGSSVPATGARVNVSIESGSGLPVVVDYNLSYNLVGSGYQYYTGGTSHGNANTVTIGTNGIFADPLYNNPSWASFTLNPLSPGWQAALPSVAPNTAILGVARNLTGPTEMGAYQQY